MAKKIRKAIQRIEKISITDEVVKRIRDLVNSGEYTVGEKLPTEMDLREQLGVGRSTIREAFRVLQALGIIELRSGRGAFVKGKNDNTYETIKEWFVEKEAELSELMEVRMAIEPIAVKLAIQRGSAAQIDQLRDIHDAFRKAVERLDAIDLATLDESFHTTIIEASNNNLLKKIGRLMADAFVEYRARSFAVQENMTHALEPHEKILSAILKKNEKEAILAVQKHLDVSLEDMSKVVNKN